MKRIVLPSLAVLLWSATPVLSADPAAPSQSETPTESSQQASGPVDKIVLASGVQSREPIDDLTAFPAGTERVYLWTRIVSDQVPLSIKHVWYADGQKVGEVPLTVNGSPWRTWSNKSVHSGQWKVEVVGENGEVLASKEFSVQ